MPSKSNTIPSNYDEAVKTKKEDIENNNQSDNMLSYHAINEFQKRTQEAIELEVSNEISDKCKPLLKKAIDFRQSQGASRRHDWDTKTEKEYSSICNELKSTLNELENSILLSSTKEIRKAVNKELKDSTMFSKKNGNIQFNVPLTENNNIDFEKIHKSEEYSYTNEILKNMKSFKNFKFMGDITPSPNRIIFALHPEQEKSIIDFTQTGTATGTGLTPVGANTHQPQYRSDQLQEFYRPDRIMDKIGVTEEQVSVYQKIPRMLTGQTASVVTEAADAPETSITFDTVNAYPERYHIKNGITQDEMLIYGGQGGSHGLDLLPIILRDAPEAIAQQHETNFWNKTGTGVTNVGVLNLTGINSSVLGAAMTHRNLQGQITALQNADSFYSNGRVCAVGNPNVRGVLADTPRTTANIQANGFILDKGMVDEYMFHHTRLIPATLSRTVSGTTHANQSPFILADFSRFVSTLFGTMFVVIDHTTEAGKAIIRINVFKYMGWVCKRPSSVSIRYEDFTI